MKKIIALLSAAIMALSLCACSGSPETDTAPQTEETQAETTKETAQTTETEENSTETESEDSTDNG